MPISIFLKEPDGRDSRRARLNAGLRVFQSDAAQSQDRNLFLAGFSQRFETGRAGGRFFLFKYWSEDREVRAFLRGAGDFGPNVAGDSDRHAGRVVPL